MFSSYGITASNYSQFEDYYAITSAEHLYGFAALVNNGIESTAKAVLLTDIVVNENCLATIAAAGTPTHSWMPIGNDNSSHAFKGTIDGQGHTISGLYFNSPISDNARNGGGMYVGLVGYGSSCTIKNIGIVDSYFYGYEYVGAIAGYITGSTSLVENCWNNSTIRNKNNMIAGVVGGNGGTVRYCYNLADLTTEGWAGGVVGYNFRGAKTTSCYNYGKIIATNSASSVVGYVDGVVANNYYLEGTYTRGTNQNIETQAKMMTKAQFRSGEVCWLLNGSSNDTTFHFFQTIGSDTIPTFNSSGSNSVYATGIIKCNGEPDGTITYSNTSGSIIVNDHNYVDGVCSVCGAYQPGYMTANGEGYFEISTAAQLYWFAAYVNAGNVTANAKLMNDIVVNTDVLKADSTLNTGDFKAWTPIGTEANKYKGTFDGQGHTISGLYFDDPTNANYPLGGKYIGFIGYAQSGAIIRNVGVINGYLRGCQYVGGISGYAVLCNISNCYNTNTITTNSSYRGGIVGYASSCSINKCYNRGKIYGNTSGYSGGIAGCAQNMTIENSYNAGSVSGRSYVGSLVGYEYTMTYNNCYYLENTAYVISSGKNYPQNGIGGSSTTAVADKANVHVATTAQFASGEITFLLNDSKSTGDLTWFQTIGTQNYPELSGSSIVYINGTISCSGKQVGEMTYQNTPGSITHLEHNYVNGICTRCGAVHPDHILTQIDGVYQIATAADLYHFAKLVNDSSKNSAKAVVTADIVVNENCLATIAAAGTPTLSWMPIGNDYSSHAFKGTIDGQGHTISGLYFNSPISDNARNGGGRYVGLVGYGSSCTIKNIGIVDSYFYGYEYVGAIAGYVTGSTSLVENCWNNSTIRNESNMIAGVVGGNGGTVRYCYNLADLTTKGWAGGVVGYNFSGAKTTSCYNYGKITGTSSASSVVGYVDGVVANNYYLEGTHSKGTNQNIEIQAKMMTKEQFRSGEVCWLLNGSSNDTTFHFFQTIGSDTIPTFKGTGIVYSLSDLRCDGTPKEVAYSNEYHTQTTDDHNYVDGICSVCGAYQPGYMTANGEGYFEISTADQLYWFAAYVNAGNVTANAKLMNDIVVNTDVLKADSTLNTGDFKAWTPIGTEANNYKGTFDGQGHTISGLYFDDPTNANYPLGGKYIGFIGYAQSGAIIRNVGVINGYLRGCQYVGGILGYAVLCNISNCYNTNTITTNSSYRGGIVGYASSCSINKCYNRGKIYSSSTSGYSGGIAGCAQNMTIENSYNAGSVSGGSYVGSLVGYEYTMTYNNCYYLENTAYVISSGKNYPQNGIGGSSTTAVADKANVHVATAAQFASGEITFLLNDSKSTGDLTWFQTIGTQNYPELSGSSIVYQIGNCSGDYFYSNTDSGTSHSLIYEDAVVATCEHAGHVAGYTCTACGKHFTTTLANEEITTANWIKNKLDHHVVNDDSIPATCTATGLTSGKHCEFCGYVFVAQDTLPALGHSFTSYKYNDDATTLADGTETAHCDHDGCSETNTRIAEGTKLTPTMLEAIARGELVVYTQHHYIVVENATETIRVYDASAQCVAMSQNTDKHVVIPMEHHGVYVVCVGDKSTKVVVK